MRTLSNANAFLRARFLTRTLYNAYAILQLERTLCFDINERA